MVPWKFCVILFTLLLITSEISTKRSSGGRRKSGSGSSSGWGWSRPKSDPKPQTNYGQTSHTNVDNRRLSYGSDTAPKPAQTNPGWVVPNSNTQQKNVGWNTQSNPGQSSSNIGWNSASGTHQNPPGSNVGWNTNQQTNQQKPIGWNVPNSQGGYNQPKPGQQPPPYPGGTSHNNPPPYNPGYNQKPGYTNQAPPPYSGYGGQNQAPPPYPGYGTNNRFGGGYPNTHNSYGYNPYQQQSHGSWGGAPGFGSPSFGSPFGGGFGRGGFGNRGGFGGGGFGGGGFGGGYGGYSPYGMGYKKKSGFGIGSVASHLGTFFAGAMLWNLASNIGRSNYQVYHNAPQRYTTSDPSGRNEYNITHDNTKPNEAKMSIDFGNMSCITIYNSEKFAKWANRTIKHVEYQTKQAFPFGNFANLQNGTTTGQVQFNFTMEPGRIIHNETVSITCCGTDHLALDFEELLSGKDPSANCVHLAAQIPFREIKVKPLNITVNITNTDLEKLANESIANTTETNSPTSNVTASVLSVEPVTMPLMQLLTTTMSPNITLVEQKNDTETSTQAQNSNTETTTHASEITTKT